MNFKIKRYAFSLVVFNICIRFAVDYTNRIIMKSILFLLGASLLLLTSCSTEMDSSLDNSIVEENAPLNINVINASTKAGSSGSLLPNNSEIGVFVTKSDGSDYHSNPPYTNIKYTGTGDTYANTWTVDPSTPVYLNFENATAYAYYPRLSSGVSLTSIPINNDGTDWMFSTPVEELNILNATANFSMQHAMSIIRVTIERLTEADDGSITQVTIDGNGWARSASLNLKTGTMSNFKGIGEQLVETNIGSLSAMNLTYDHMILPTGNTTNLTFTVTYDSKIYTSTISDITFLTNKVYNYKLSVGHNEALLINPVSVTDWDRSFSADLDYSTYNPIISWGEAKLFDGVYGILADGKAMFYDEALKTSETLTGVAFVIKGKAYQVAKVNAYDDKNFQWVMDNTTVPGLTNYDKADGTNMTGHLGGPNTPQLSQDPYTWTAGALTDFDGPANTAKIIAALSNNSDDINIGKAVMDFRNGTNNEGKTDWFIPSCGELACMYLMRNELNALLAKVNGGSAIFTWDYWSSSIPHSGGVWTVTTDGCVYPWSNSSYLKLRLFRAL